MATIFEKYLNVVEVLSKALFLLKAHEDHSKKLSEDYKNLQKAYSNFIGLNSNGNEIPIELEMLHEPNELEENRTEWSENSEETTDMFEVQIIDEPVEKLVVLWNRQDKEEKASINNQESEESQLSSKSKFNFRSKQVQAKNVKVRHQGQPAISANTADERHECGFCLKRHLTKHLRIHDQKLFECALCPMKFIRSG